MITIDVFLIREDDGSFLADAHHDYNVGLFGIGQTADEALDDLRTVIDEAREFCNELPASSEFEFNVLQKKVAHVECNERGYYTVYTNEEFPFGCFGEGFEIDKAIDDFLKTFECFCSEHEKLTGEKIDVEFIFVNDVSATLHEAEKYINLKSLAKITGIRNDILKQYASGKRIPKSEQEARIIKGIHEIADKLLEII